ncbi:hypothetical protein HanXRQr2_Chr05g0217681 [Helianthus annuus]|uniref:Uncharacterized protein n=1 Tax=Helianthus annuus TaxID=4232 RepID=A0A9K3J0M9_HELAN|nr:hypothetical protein HanXRQr2_Chr05g0217681 [Helianthus annuus]
MQCQEAMFTKFILESVPNEDKNKFQVNPSTQPGASKPMPLNHRLRPKSPLPNCPILHLKLTNRHAPL